MSRVNRLRPVIRLAGRTRSVSEGFGVTAEGFAIGGIESLRFMSSFSRSFGVLALLAAACGRGTPPPHPASDWPAVDADVADLPGVLGQWVPDPVYGGQVYVLEVSPPTEAVEGTGAEAAVPPLLLVHGISEGGVRDFYPVMRQLAKDRRVIAIDLPGFGRSSRQNVRYNPKGYAELLEHLVRQRVRGRVDVVGHSMGGAIAIAFAGGAPDLVRRLVLADVAGVLHRDALVSGKVTRTVNRDGGSKPSLANQADRALGAMLRGLTNAAPDPEIALSTRYGRRLVLKSEPARIAALALIVENLGPSIAAIEAPTLVLWGRKDEVAPLRTGRLLADRIEGAHLDVFDKAGHVPMTDAPERFVRAVSRHLHAQTAAPVEPPTAEPSLEGGRVGRCEGRAEEVFEGDYARIELVDCHRVHLRNVRVGSLEAERSTVIAEGTVITAGLSAWRSEFTMTGGGIAGDVAMHLGRTRLDLAGVAIHGASQAVLSKGSVRILFSACPVRSGDTQSYLHGVHELVEGATL